MTLLQLWRLSLFTVANSTRDLSAQMQLKSAFFDVAFEVESRGVRFLCSSHALYSVFAPFAPAVFQELVPLVQQHFKLQLTSWSIHMLPLSELVALQEIGRIATPQQLQEIDAQMRRLENRGLDPVAIQEALQESASVAISPVVTPASAVVTTQAVAAAPVKAVTTAPAEAVTTAPAVVTVSSESVTEEADSLSQNIASSEIVEEPEVITTNAANTDDTSDAAMVVAVDEPSECAAQSMAPVPAVDAETKAEADIKAESAVSLEAAAADEDTVTVADTVEVLAQDHISEKATELETSSSEPIEPVRIETEQTAMREESARQQNLHKGLVSIGSACSVIGASVEVHSAFVPSVYDRSTQDLGALASDQLFSLDPQCLIAPDFGCSLVAGFVEQTLNASAFAGELELESSAGAYEYMACPYSSFIVLGQFMVESSPRWGRDLKFSPTQESFPKELLSLSTLQVNGTTLCQGQIKAHFASESGHILRAANAEAVGVGMALGGTRFPTRAVMHDALRQSRLAAFASLEQLGYITLALDFACEQDDQSSVKRVSVLVSNRASASASASACLLHNSVFLDAATLALSPEDLYNVPSAYTHYYAEPQAVTFEHGTIQGYTPSAGTVVPFENREQLIAQSVVAAVIDVAERQREYQRVAPASASVVSVQEQEAINARIEAEALAYIGVDPQDALLQDVMLPSEQSHKILDTTSHDAVVSAVVMEQTAGAAQAAKPDQSTSESKLDSMILGFMHQEQQGVVQAKTTEEEPSVPNASFIGASQAEALKLAVPVYANSNEPKQNVHFAGGFRLAQESLFLAAKDYANASLSERDNHWWKKDFINEEQTSHTVPELIYQSEVIIKPVGLTARSLKTLVSAMSHLKPDNTVGVMSDRVEPARSASVESAQNKEFSSEAFGVESDEDRATVDAHASSVVKEPPISAPALSTQPNIPSTVADSGPVAETLQPVETGLVADNAVLAQASAANPVAASATSDGVEVVQDQKQVSTPVQVADAQRSDEHMPTTSAVAHSAAEVQHENVEPTAVKQTDVVAVAATTEPVEKDALQKCCSERVADAPSLQAVDAAVAGNHVEVGAESHDSEASSQKCCSERVADTTAQTVDVAVAGQKQKETEAVTSSSVQKCCSDLGSAKSDVAANVAVAVAGGLEKPMAQDSQVALVQTCCSDRSCVESGVTANVAVAVAGLQQEAVTNSSSVENCSERTVSVASTSAVAEQAAVLTAPMPSEAQVGSAGVAQMPEAAVPATTQPEAMQPHVSPVQVETAPVHMNVAGGVDRAQGLMQANGVVQDTVVAPYPTAGAGAPVAAPADQASAVDALEQMLPNALLDAVRQGAQRADQSLAAAAAPLPANSLPRAGSPVVQVMPAEHNQAMSAQFGETQKPVAELQGAPVMENGSGVDRLNAARMNSVRALDMAIPELQQLAQSTRHGAALAAAHAHGMSHNAAAQAGCGVAPNQSQGFAQGQAYSQGQAYGQAQAYGQGQVYGQGQSFGAGADQMVMPVQGETNSWQSFNPEFAQSQAQSPAQFGAESFTSTQGGADRFAVSPEQNQVFAQREPFMSAGDAVMNSGAFESSNMQPMAPTGQAQLHLQTEFGAPASFGNDQNFGNTQSFGNVPSMGERAQFGAPSATSGQGDGYMSAPNNGGLNEPSGVVVNNVAAAQFNASRPATAAVEPAATPEAMPQEAAFDRAAAFAGNNSFAQPSAQDGFGAQGQQYQQGPQAQFGPQAPMGQQGPMGPQGPQGLQGFGAGADVEMDPDLTPEEIELMRAKAEKAAKCKVRALAAAKAQALANNIPSPPVDFVTPLPTKEETLVPLNGGYVISSPPRRDRKPKPDYEQPMSAPNAANMAAGNAPVSAGRALVPTANVGRELLPSAAQGWSAGSGGYSGNNGGFNGAAEGMSYEDLQAGRGADGHAAKRLKTVWVNGQPQQVEVWEELDLPRSAYNDPRTGRSLNTKPIDPSQVFAKCKHLTLMPDMTFERFICGPQENIQGMVQALRDAALSPGAPSHNPIFLHGISGAGKSHLVQGLIHELMLVHPKLKIGYFSASDFVKYYVSQVSNMQQVHYSPEQVYFTQSFTNYDVLVMEDIQHLARANKSRLAFADIVAQILDMPGKMLVCTSDRNTERLFGMNFEQSLISRMCSGLTFEVPAPERNVRWEVVKRFMEERGYKVSDGGANCICATIGTDIREILGVLKTVCATPLRVDELGFADFTELVNRLDNFKKVAGPKLTLGLIQKSVAQYFGISVEEMLSPTKKRKVSLARAFAMLLARERLELSLHDIGVAFNKDHSSVYEAVERLRERCRSNTELQTTYLTFQSQFLP